VEAEVTPGGADTLASEVVSILSASTFFADLTSEQLGSLAPICRVVDFSQGSRIYGLGDQALDLYVLVDGLVSFTIGHGNHHASGGEIIRSGDVFGWAAVVEGAERRIAAADCMTQCRVLAVEGNKLLKAMDRDHSMGYHLMKQLTLLITGELTAFASG